MQVILTSLLDHILPHWGTSKQSKVPMNKTVRHLDQTILEVQVHGEQFNEDLAQEEHPLQNHLMDQVEVVMTAQEDQIWDLLVDK